MHVTFNTNTTTEKNFNSFQKITAAIAQFVTIHVFNFVIAGRYEFFNNLLNIDRHE